MANKILNILDTKERYVIKDESGKQVGRKFTNISNAIYKSNMIDQDAWNEGNKDFHTYVHTEEISEKEQDEQLLKVLNDKPVELNKQHKLVIARALVALRDKLKAEHVVCSNYYGDIYSVLDFLAL